MILYFIPRENKYSGSQQRSVLHHWELYWNRCMKFPNISGRSSFFHFVPLNTTRTKVSPFGGKPSMNVSDWITKSTIIPTLQTSYWQLGEYNGLWWYTILSCAWTILYLIDLEQISPHHGKSINRIWSLFFTVIPYNDNSYF